MSLSNFKRFNINFGLQLGEFVDIIRQLNTVDLLERSLAAWTTHESEGDLQGRPPMLQELSYAFCMENVATIEQYAGVRLKLCCVTDCAKFVFL